MKNSLFGSYYAVLQLKTNFKPLTCTIFLILEKIKLVEQCADATDAYRGFFQTAVNQQTSTQPYANTASSPMNHAISCLLIITHLNTTTLI